MIFENHYILFTKLLLKLIRQIRQNKLYAHNIVVNIFRNKMYYLQDVDVAILNMYYLLKLDCNIASLTEV